MATLMEVEVLPGLKPFALQELKRVFGAKVELLEGRSETDIPLYYTGSPADLHQLRLVVATYLVLHFDIPRPKALLGHEHFSRLTGQIDRVRGMNSKGAFSTFRFSAAGKWSNVFERLRDSLADHTHLVNTPDEADLLLRVRPAKTRSSGWEVLIRTTPLPLSKRPWRKVNLEGALNATIAAAMVEMTQPTSQDAYFNLMCGSGTLLIERAAWGPATAIAGNDNDPGVLEIADVNIQAAGYQDEIELLMMDIHSLELPDGVVDVITVDPPWGQVIGTARLVDELYPPILREAGRIAAPECRMVAISHAINAFDQALIDAADIWKLEETIRVFQGGLHPRIYRLTRI